MRLMRIGVVMVSAFASFPSLSIAKSALPGSMVCSSKRDSMELSLVKKGKDQILEAVRITTGSSGFPVSSKSVVTLTKSSAVGGRDNQIFVEVNDGRDTKLNIVFEEVEKGYLLTINSGNASFKKSFLELLGFNEGENLVFDECEIR